MECPINVLLVTGRVKHYKGLEFSISSLVNLSLQYIVQCHHATLDLVLAKLSCASDFVKDHLGVLLFIEFNKLMLLEESCGDDFVFIILVLLCCKVMPEELYTLLVAELEINGRGNHLVRFVDHFILWVLFGF